MVESVYPVADRAHTNTGTPPPKPLSMDCHTPEETLFKRPIIAQSVDLIHLFDGFSQGEIPKDTTVAGVALPVYGPKMQTGQCLPFRSEQGND